MAAELGWLARTDNVAAQSTAGTRVRSAAALVLLAAAAVVAWLLTSRVGYVPMWDGFVYAEAIADAVAWPPSLGALRLAGHASQAYAAVAVAFQALAPGTFWPLLLLNAVFLLLACVGFHRLLRLAFPDPAYRLERALLTAAFAVQPSLLAAVVQPGLDLPVVPGFIWCTVLMMEKRWLATILVGIVVAFTKETAVLLYAVLLATYALWTLVRTPGPLGTRLGRVLRLAPLAIPGVVFGLYLVWRRHSAPAGDPVVWNAGTAMIGQSLVRQLLVPRIDRYLASFLAMMGVLNFAWIATGFIAAGFVAYARRLKRTAAARDAWRAILDAIGSNIGFLVLLTASSAYALTRFATYANSRYVLPIIALVYVLFLAALFTCVARAAIRRGVLGVFALLLVGSTVRTVDPISRALFGTFPIGDRELLRMTSITHECCGSGRDQLVYNLEFTTLEALTSDAFAALAPNDSTLIVIPDSTDWFVATRLDRVTHRRTVRREGALTPRVVEDDSVSRSPAVIAPSASTWFVALPNAGARRALSALSERYVVGGERRHRRGPYALSVYPLTPRTGVVRGRGDPSP